MVNLLAGPVFILITIRQLGHSYELRRMVIFPNEPEIGVRIGNPNANPNLKQEKLPCAGVRTFDCGQKDSVLSDFRWAR